MIVDDDPDDRFFFHEAIKKINTSHECIEVDAGHKALTHLRAAPRLPNYIFLDINMPLMDGKEVLRELKKDEKFKNTPVIIYSSSSYHVDIDETKQLGAAHFITKTFHIDNLPADITLALDAVDQSQMS